MLHKSYNATSSAIFLSKNNFLVMAIHCSFLNYLIVNTNIWYNDIKCKSCRMQKTFSTNIICHNSGIMNHMMWCTVVTNILWNTLTALVFELACIPNISARTFILLIAICGQITLSGWISSIWKKNIYMKATRSCTNVTGDASLHQNVLRFVLQIHMSAMWQTLSCQLHH